MKVCQQKNCQILFPSTEMFKIEKKRAIFEKEVLQHFFRSVGRQNTSKGHESVTLSSLFLHNNNKLTPAAL